jgi:tryptophan synthase alpha chain
MNTIESTFIPGRTVLCPFLTAGYPSLDLLTPLLLAAQSAGAGCIELGIPFSDPVADGPVIQESYYRALSGGATVPAILEAVSKSRAAGVKVPLMAMASFSIIFKIGTRQVARSFAQAGFTGMVLPDLPIEEAPGIVEELSHAGLSACLLVAPTTPARRQTEIVRWCTGFVYYLSVSGITGERTSLPPGLEDKIAGVKQMTKRPVCVGFGISSAQHVRALAGKADGVIVGSALVRRINRAVESRTDPVEAVRRFVAELSTGLAPS